MLVHVETNEIRPDVNGVFSQVLGTQPDRPIDLADVADGTEPRWMSVVVDGVEFLPRQRLVSVPYAIHAFAGVPPGTILAYGGTRPPPGFLMCDGQDYRRTSHPGLFAAIGTAFGAPDGDRFNVPDLRGQFLRGSDDMGTPRGDANRDPDQASRVAMAAGGYSGTANGGLGSVQRQATHRNGLSSGRSTRFSFAAADHTHEAGSLRALVFRGGADAIISYGDHTGSYPAGKNQRNQGGWIDDSGNYQGSKTTRVEGDTAKPNRTITLELGVSLDEGDRETRPDNAGVNYIIKE